MRVLSLTTVFPNPAQPRHGLFVRERLRHAAIAAEITVVAPVPYFPLVSGRMAIRPLEVPPRRTDGPFQVHHPRFWSPPGVGKSLDGLLYAASVRATVERLHRRAGFDLLDAHFAYPDGFAAVLLGRRLGIPVTITLRGTLADLKDRPSRRWALRWALDRADAIFSVSAGLRRDAMSLGVSGDRIQVLPNGVDSDRFRVRPRTQARRRLGIPEEGPLIVSVGALRRVKGHDRLLRAFARVAADRPEVRLAIVGGRSISDDCSATLRDLAAELGIERRVLWPGARPHEEIPWWLAAADVFALASRREGCCNALLEALSCGRPVVATAVGGNPEIVRSPELGAVVPPDDPQALARALSRALDTDWDAREIRAHVADRSWESVGARQVDRWRAVVADRRPAHRVAPVEVR